MKSREEFDKMIRLYQKFMIEPLVENGTPYIFLENDKYDAIKIVHSYNLTDYSVRFVAIRERSDMYVINKMDCILADVHMFDIERWYEDYLKLIEKSKEWKWVY